MKDLNSIYYAARKLPAEDRPAYLTQACGDDPELRARVVQMLSVADEAEAFFTRSLPDVTLEDREPTHGPAKFVRPDPYDGPDEIVGQMIGRYKILERLDEGGCGVVYVAEQTEPVRRRVALKVIKLGMDTKQVIARFEAERQALAMMDHPNIAKVFDGGATDQGRPFFVMELVRGIRITDYCDQCNLPPKERLDLFIKVCQAIQHAHQKGIIHRDIKPSNILVTLNDGVPVPKVIDFGIAKATEGRLTDATIYTQLHQFIGTPAYMSPEQAEISSLDIDTRSDIYSLGVLLYELLAGCTPFDGRELISQGLDTMRRTIREKDPARPSLRLASLQGDELTTTASRRAIEAPKLIHLLKGDLDWIVMKCLEKDRGRRYETASGLASDLKRHLDNEPVTARPPSVTYKCLKAIHRNKLAFTAVAAVALALLLGTAVSTWQAAVATRARQAESEERMAAQNAQARAEAETRRAEWLVYSTKLKLAQSDFENGNGGLVRHHLEECEESHRGWEWRYLWTRMIPRQALVAHRGPVTSAAFSTDGMSIITGSWDGSAKIWDAATGRELIELAGHTGRLFSVAFSPDGRRVVTSSDDQTAKAWDAATGRETLTLKGHTGFVLSMAFSPDGTRIVTGSSDQTAKIWDARTGEELLTLEGHSDFVRSVAFSPDGMRIVTGGRDMTAKVWDVRTGRDTLTLEGHAHWVSSVAFSPDGTRIVTGSDDQTAKVWNAVTGEEISTLQGHVDRVISVAFSPDGKRIVTGSGDQMVKVWDAATGGEIFTLKGHAEGVTSVAFSPDGSRIVTGSADWMAKVWDAEKGQEVPTFRGHGDYVSSIAFSADSKRMVTGSGDRTAKVWDVMTGRELLALNGHTGELLGVAFSPDGKQIVTGSVDRTARVWDAATGRELLALQHAHALTSVAFSPDGTRIVTGIGERGGGGQGGAIVWDAAAGQELLVLPYTDVVWSVGFSPEGKRIVTAAEDRTARVWDAATGKEILALKGHSGPVTSAVFSADGQRIVTGGWDQVAKVWDAGSGRELLTLEGHTGSVRRVAFSHDGERIVTGGDDRTVRLWNAATGEEALALRGYTEVVWSLALSPDGTRIATGIAGANATVKVFYAPPPP